MDVNVNFQVDNDSVNEMIEIPSNASIKHSHSVLPSSNSNRSHHEREIKRTVSRTGPIRSTELGQTSAGQENLDNIRIKGSHKKPNAESSHHSKSEDRNSQHSSSEAESSAGSKANNQPIRNSLRANDSIEAECCNNRSNSNVQPMISSTPMSRHLHSEFSTRWPPTPIRSSYVGRTTAGRWLYNGQNIYDQSEKPFYDHSPAGIPTIYTGTVGECMRWNYGNSSAPQNIRDGQQRSTNQQYNSQDGRDWDVSVNVGIGLAESHRR